MSQSDSPSFVAAIADRYSRRLRRFLSVRLRNAADVPDLAQEVFLRLLRFEDHGNITNPQAYLFTVASHVIHQHTVRRSTAPITLDFADLSGEPQALSSDDPQRRRCPAARQRAATFDGETAAAMHPKRPYVSHIATVNPYNLQPLASKGNAVLLPAMPGETHEYHRLLNGVLPRSINSSRWVSPIRIGWRSPARAMAVSLPMD